MQTRFMPVCTLAVLLTACSDSPEAPVVEKTTPYQFPNTQVAPLAIPQPTSPLVGPRMEVYSNGVLKQVLSAAAADDPTPRPAAAATFPANFDQALEQLARHPVNKRTAQFARLLQTVARVPASGRAQAMRAVSKQLLRETEHRDTILADGSRIIEYYFDHKLASRVVLGPDERLARVAGTAAAPAQAVFADLGCETGCEELTVDDAELWATIVWYADQTQAMVDYVSVEGDANGLYLVVFEKTCLGAIGGWALSVGSLGYGIARIAEGWGLASNIVKQGGVITAGGLFAGAVGAWNNMHDCFHS